METIFASASLNFVLLSFTKQAEGKINLLFEDTEQLVGTVSIVDGKFFIGESEVSEQYVRELLDKHDSLEGDLAVTW